MNDRALLLADFCDFNVLYQPAAAELRRLHEENKELRHATGVANQTIAAVVAQRNELLEALKIALAALDADVDNAPISPVVARSAQAWIKGKFGEAARAAIAKAEGA